jgi:hypothetical protein
MHKETKGMKELLSFQSTIPQNYQGTISYEYNLDQPLSKMEITLSYNHERPADPKAYLQKYRTFLTKKLEAYLGRKASEEDLLKAIASMKTEIQFALFLDEKFICNIHKPGNNKKMLVTADDVSKAAAFMQAIKGQVKIVINVFAVIEDDTSIVLTIAGEEEHVQAY